MEPKIIMKLTIDLIPYVRNARTHSIDQVAQVAASIKEYGFINPVLVDEKNGIIAGHCRVLAAQKLGLDVVPTIAYPHLTEQQKRAYIIKDNQLALNAGWDEEMLSLELIDLDAGGFNIGLLGFDEEDLSRLMQDDESEDGLTDDAVPDVLEKPVNRLGDIWLLGSHVLMCGDSTNVNDISLLTDGINIDLIHTDPPYGINEKCDRTSRGSLTKANKFKNIRGGENTDCAAKTFKLAQSLNVSRQVWWGANHYAHAVPQTANWFVWDKRVEDKQKDNNSDCELAWVKSKWSSIRIFRHLWKGLIKASEKGQKRIHPTQKPVALIEWVFDYYKNIKTVLDLFGGSGSTLIAAENRGLKSLLMEIEPTFCDVIITRWQNYTGKTATLASTGQTFEETAKERTNLMSFTVRNNL